MTQQDQCFNPYSPGFSIYLELFTNEEEAINCFNPYSPGFSIYLNYYEFEEEEISGFNPYSPGFSIYLVYLLDILIRSISSKLFDT